MEILLNSVMALLVPTLLCCVLVHLFILIAKKNTIKGEGFPQGRIGLPLIGETFEFLSEGKNGTLDRFFHRRMAKYSPEVFKTSILGEKTVVLCGAAGNKFLFSNDGTVVAAWWPRTIKKIFVTTPQSFTNEMSMRPRKIMASFLKPEALQKYVGVMDSMAKQHLNLYWEGRKEVVVFSVAKQYTFFVACKLFLSMDDHQQITKFVSPFYALLTGIFSIPVNFPGTDYNRAIRAAEVIREQLLDIIQRRRKERNIEKAVQIHDVLSHMLTARDEMGRLLTDTEIADHIVALLIGGHDTTSTAITATVKYLAELPDIHQKVLKELRAISEEKKAGEILSWEDIQKMRYTWNVVSEAMRLVPPIPGNFREAIADFVYSGVLIPRGWKLYWSAVSTHKNPKYFQQPERFDPSRFEGNGPIPYTYIPFGGGPHLCPGKEFARIEILAFLYNLVTTFRWENLIPDEKFEMAPMPAPAKGLPVRLFPLGQTNN